MPPTRLIIRPENVIRALRKTGPMFHAGVTKGMTTAVREVFDPLMALTPLDTGLTRGSFAAFDGDNRIFVSNWGSRAGEAAALDHGLPLQTSARNLVLTFNTYYSATIHENLLGVTFRAPGTQAKFLESIFYAYASQLVQTISASAQRGMTGLIGT